MKKQILTDINNLGTRCARAAAGLLLIAAVAMSAACGSSGSSPTQPTEPKETGNTPANTTASFTTDGGNYIRKQITIPATMTFKVTGVDGDDDRDMQPIVYFYDQYGFSGGRGGRGFNGDLRNQKLKVYDVNDDLMGIESERYGYDWNSDDIVPCEISWDAGGVSININGTTFRKEGPVPPTFTIGIGVPPEIRQGWIGITFTDIVWPVGSVDVP